MGREKKEALCIRQLEQYRREGSALRDEWEGAGYHGDKQRAMGLHRREREEWWPAVRELLQQVAPWCVHRYEFLGEAPGVFNEQFAAWDGETGGDMEPGFRCHCTRLSMLRDDISGLARKYGVSFEKPKRGRPANGDGPANKHAEKWSERLKKEKREHGSERAVAEIIASECGHKWSVETIQREVRAFRRGC